MCLCFIKQWRIPTVQRDFTIYPCAFWNRWDLICCVCTGFVFTKTWPVHIDLASLFYTFSWVMCVPSCCPEWHRDEARNCETQCVPWVITYVGCIPMWLCALVVQIFVKLCCLLWIKAKGGGYVCQVKFLCMCQSFRQQIKCSTLKLHECEREHKSVKENLESPLSLSLIYTVQLDKKNPSSFVYWKILKIGVINF